MGIKESLEGFGKKLAHQPWYVWAGVMGGAGLIGYYVLKQRAAQQAAANTQQNYTTPGAMDQAALDQALNGVELANMAGIPYGYQNSYGPVDNYPQTTASNSTPATTETTAGDTSSSTTSATSSTASTTPTTNTVNQSNTSTGSTNAQNTSVQSNTSGPIQEDPNPYAGLLGPNVAVNFQSRTFTSPTIKNTTPLPIPAQDKLVQGGQNRVWYIDNGIQHLLTDGLGPPVTNSGYPVNSPQNTPSSGSGGGGWQEPNWHDPVNSVRNTVWDLTKAGVGHSEEGYWNE